MSLICDLALPPGGKHQIVSVQFEHCMFRGPSAWNPYFRYGHTNRQNLYMNIVYLLKFLYLRDSFVPSFTYLLVVFVCLFFSNHYDAIRLAFLELIMFVI